MASRNGSNDSTAPQYNSLERNVGSETPGKKHLSWLLFTPLAFAPCIPLTRVMLTRAGASHRTVSRATLGVVGLAVLHGLAVMSTLNSIS